MKLTDEQYEANGMTPGEWERIPDGTVRTFWCSGTTEGEVEYSGRRVIVLAVIDPDLWGERGPMYLVAVEDIPDIHLIVFEDEITEGAA